jgi:TonB family protein
MYEPQRQGCWGRNWKWIVPTGCLGLIILALAAAAGIFFFAVSAVKSSEPYRRAFEKARNDPAVIAELGQPISDGWYVSGSIETNRSGSGAKFHFPISGPKNSGTVYVSALKVRELYGDDDWHFETLEVEVNGKPGRINLVEDTGEPGGTGVDVEVPPPPPPPGLSSNHPPVSGGVLDDKAVSKPAPAYPPIAKAAKASGKVTVMVTVDESGNVVEAHAVSGHPLLQAAAVAAARQAKFAPMKLSGQPVKFTGVLTYNFVPE